MAQDEGPSEARRREADLSLIDSLLRLAIRPNRQAREDRIRRVLNAILAHDHLEHSDPDPEQARRFWQRRRVRRWSPLLSAAAVLVVLSLWWLTDDSTPQAFATVARSLEEAKELGPRHYRFTSIVRRRRTGEQEVVGDLYFDGGERFAMRHPGVLPVSEFWVGSSGQEEWIVPPVGPILTGDAGLIAKWIVEREDVTMPFLHLTTMLERLSDAYDLELLEDETIDNPLDAGTTLRCRRVRGILHAQDRRLLPKSIDLWAGRETGIAYRIVLDWGLPPEGFGRSQISIELIDEAELPTDWFEAGAHRRARRGFRAGRD